MKISRAGVGLAICAVVLAVTAAAGAVGAPGITGPVYPLPGHSGVGHGGDTCAAASATEGQEGKTGGQTWTFGGGGDTDTVGTTCPVSTDTPPPFDTTRFQTLYWGADSSSDANSPQIALDGAVDTAGETLAFDSTDSDLAAGKLVWTGQTNMTWCVAASCSFTTSAIDTRFTLTITDLSGTPVALTDPASVGIGNASEVGGVVAVTPDLTNFKANFLFEAKNPQSGVFQPALTMYNSFNHPSSAPQPETLMSFTGGFWYVDRPPTASFTVQPPSPAAGAQVQFDASGSSDADGTVESYSWDLNGDGTFGDSNSETPTATYTGGTHVVSLQVTDDDGSTATAEHTFKIPPTAKLAVPAQKLRNAIKSGLKGKLTVDEPAAGKLTLKLSTKDAKKLGLKSAIGTATVKLTAAGTKSFTVKLTSKAKSKLAHVKSVGMVLAGTVTDSGKNVSRVSKTFSLKH